MKSNKLVKLLILLVCISPLTILATDQSLRSPEVINVMPAFWKYEMQDSRLTTQAAKVMAFRKLVVGQNTEIYKLPEFANDLTDAGITHYITAIRKYLPEMHALTTSVSTQVAPTLARFMEHFPEFDGQDISVAFLPSFGHFNGQTTNLEDGRTIVMFGIDVIAATQKSGVDMGVLVSHELFHAYHRQVNPEVFQNNELYAKVWIEGLAVYASGKLNPKSSEASILASRALASDKPDLLSKAARGFLPVFSSTNSNDAYEFLNSSYRGSLPPRSGYLLGYEVCKNIGRHYTIRQMARLGGAQLKSLIHSTIEKLAKR